MTAGSSARSAPSRPFVLVVEDDRDAQQLLVMALEMEGFEVRTACNGEEALRLIDDEVPLAMIVDLMMPVMDGMEFRKIQRKDVRTAHVQFIVVTAVPDGFDIAARLGADAFLGKPFDPERLVRVLRGCLPRPGGN